MMKKKVSKEKQKKKMQKIGAALVAVMLIAAMVIGLMPADSVIAATTADLDTTTKYLESLGDEVSTEYAGRVWTDKSVWSEDSVTIEAYAPEGETKPQYAITKNDAEKEEDRDEDFLVGFSALATSQSVSGQAQAPVDVVFILDMSSSMRTTMDDGDSRLENAVEALNTAVDKVLSLSEHSRVGVVSYNGTSYEILPLDHYTKINNKSFFTWKSGNSIDVSAQGSTQSYTQNVKYNSGTNIQKGIAGGMQLLIDETETTVQVNGTTVQRVPSVVLLSDGQPSCSSDYTTWWDIESDTDYHGVNGNYAIHGMRAIMTAAYMKDAIDRNYGGGTDGNITKVYTIGLGIDDLDSSSRNLAYATLDPKNHLDDNNDMAEDMLATWESYLDGGRPSLGGYSFTHPTSNDIDYADAAMYTDAYYSAQNANDVADVFDDIVNSISLSRPEVPTEHDTANPLTSGYITYTDPIGEYMEVKKVKGIIYAGQLFTAHRDSEKIGSATDYTETHIFEGQAGNEVYGEHDLSHLIIQVHTTVDANGIKTQKMTVKIPAAMIPVRVNTVQLNTDGTVKSHTNNGTYPIRVLYTVGLQDVIKEDGYINAEKISDTYKEKNTNADGTIDFYSNLYTGKNVVNGSTAGDATVEFEAAHTNPFYYMQKNTPIYTDAACTELTSTATELQDDVTYYYPETYYHGTQIVVEEVARTGKQLKAAGVVNIDGVWNRPVGSPRTNRMLEFEGTKTLNSTQTAEDFYAPTFENKGVTPYDGKFVVYLGNNGVLSAIAGGMLDITKTVTADEGLTAPDKEFTFTVNLNSSLGAALTGTYSYEVLDASGNAVLDENEKAVVGTISDGGTLTLKAGQTARIVNLPPNATYTITEAAVTGFTTTVNSAIGMTAEGTIAAGETNTEVFNNHYSVSPVTFPAEDGLTGKKVLSGRAANSELDKYTFFLTPYNNAPLPDGYDSTNGVEVTLTSSEATFDFGSIQFTKPGVYRYTIVEKEPENTEYLPGMTYSRALYRVVVTVTDNGDGTLSTSADIQQLYTDDATQLFEYDESNNIQMLPGYEGQDPVVFTNTYKAGSVTRTPLAIKNYTDHSGVNPLVSGMFQFTIEPVGYSYDGGETVDETNVANVPMPLDSNNNRLTSVTTTNEGHNVTFPSVTFTEANLMGGESITFVYKFKEVMPDTAKAENNYTVNGMTYDPTEIFGYVTISKVANSAELQVNAVYSTGKPSESTYRIAQFTNSYAQTPVTLTGDTALKVSKLFTGRVDNAWLEGDSFEFTLAADMTDAATAAALEAGKIVMKDSTDGTDTVTIISADTEKVKAFTDITFTSEGTYVFKITETKGDITAVTYDETVYTVTVTVTDADKDSVLEAVTVYNDGTTNTENAVFENEYTTVSTEPVSILGTKHLTGRPLESGQFFFEVIAQSGAARGTRVGLVTSTSDAEADQDGVYEGTMYLLNNITFDEVGVYEYIIREQIPDGAEGNVLNGVTYDGTIYKVTVTVTDDTNGKLVAQTKIDKVEETNGSYTVVEANVSEIVFSNTYKTTPVSPVIYPAYKVLSGNREEALKDGEFTFEVSVVGDTTGYTFGTYTEGMTLISGPKTTINKADGTITPVNDQAITFIKPGDYTIQMKEVIPAEAKLVDGEYVYNGITYDTHVLSSTFRVTDDGNGNLVVTRLSTTGATTFTNVYNATGELDGATNLIVTKVFTGRPDNAWLDTDSFTFVLEGYGDATKEAIAEGTVVLPANAAELIIKAEDTSYTKAFDNIVFYKAGTYQFMIREVEGNIPGVNYDGSGKVITVTVTDNNDGTLTASVPEQERNSTFTNTYDPDSVVLIGHGNLHVTKVLEGREWLDTDTFTFKLEAGDDVTQTAIESRKIELPQNAAGLDIVKNNDGVAHFGDITFHETGNYVFKVSEVIPEEAELVDGNYVLNGITYSTDEKLVNVKVTDNTAAELVVEITNISEDGYLTFTNTYDSDSVILPGATNLRVVKSLEGRDWDIFGTDEFNFTLEAYDEETSKAVADGVIVLPTNATGITIKAIDPKVSISYGEFGDILFKEAGTYRFVIKETIPEEADKATNIAYDEHSTIVTVIVTDDLKGQLVIVQEGGVAYSDSMTWTNTYTPEPATAVIEAEKVLVGRDWKVTDRFTFMLSSSVTGTPMPSSVYAVASGADADHGIVFGEITYNTVGTYTYDVDEIGNYAGITNDTRELKVIVTVTNNEEEGQLGAVVTYKMSDEFTYDEFTEEIRKFVNRYDSEGELDGSTYLQVTKNFTGRPDNAWLDTDSFTFTLVANEADEATKAALDANKIVMPESTLTITSANKANAAFGNIKFMQAGTYQFIVTETEGTLEGVTYDTTPRTVVVTVTDNGDGTLTAVTDDELIFDNTYSADGSLDGDIYLDITKNFTGREWRATDQFTFVLEAEGEAAVKGLADGTIVLPATDAVTAQLAADGKIVMPADGTGITISGSEVLANELPSVEVPDEEGGGTHFVYKKAFGDIQFTKAGVYQFRIHEAKPVAVEVGQEPNVILGVLYDSTPRIVTVTVTDNGDATLSAEAEVTTGTSLTFNNVYDPKLEPLNGHNNLHVEKVFTGRPNNEWLATDSFVFTLEAYIADEATQTALSAGNIIMPESTSLEVTKDNKEFAHFGNIYFKQMGEYKFVVKEVVPEGGVSNGITYDTTARRITVYVREVEEGSDHILRATVASVETGTLAGNEFTETGVVADKSLTFTNTYDAQDAVLDGTTNLMVNKNLVGREWFEDDRFTFTIAADEDYGTKVVMPTETSVVIGNNANHQAAFGNITFTEIGTYRFTISEEAIAEAEDRSTLTCSTDPVTVTVEVTDNGLGQLVATPSYEDDNTTLTFQNTYTPAPISVSLEGTKALTEPNGNALTFEEGKFEFAVSRPAGSADSVPEVNGATASAKNDENGKVTFANVVTFTEAGTYVYDIKEVAGTDSTIKYDGTTVKATIEVTYDPATGKLTAKVPTYSVSDGNGGFAFTNVYESRPVTFSLDAVKTVDKTNGEYEMAAGDFEFVIHTDGKDNDPVRDGMLVRNQADGTINLFKDVIYRHEGTYTYTVSEVNRQYAGFSYDSTIYEVEVKVTYNKGQLVATPTITKVVGESRTEVEAAEFVFNNTYDVYKTEVAIAGTKVLENVGFTESGFDFEFKLVPVSYTDAEDVTTTHAEKAMPMPEKDTVTNEGGVFTFGKMTFTKDMIGTYKYQVVEVEGNIPGVTYDGTVHEVTITVALADVTDKDGTLHKDAIVVTVDKDQDDIVFTNTYVPNKVTLSGETALKGTKTLKGRTINAGEFTFVLAPADDKTPMPAIATATNDSAGDFAFGKITFDKVGTYTYTITEQKGTLGGVTYDESSFSVKVEVTDEGFDGQLDAKVTYYKGENEASVAFENTYAAKPTSIILDGMKKSLSDKELEAGKFEFVLEAKTEGAPMPEKATVTNGALGDVSRISFGEIKFTKAGTYEYEISETNNNIEYIVYDTVKHVVKIKVTDNLEGQLVAEVIAPEASVNGLSGIVFNNRYEAPNVSILKTQKINDKVVANSSKVVAGDVVTYVVTVTNNGTGSATELVIEDKIPEGLLLVEDSISDNGTLKDGVITWKISELARGESKSVSFEVSVPVVNEKTEWENVASVSYGNNPENPDPTPENPDPEPEKEESNPVEVTEYVPEIEIVKEQKVNGGASLTTPQEVQPGDKVTYTLRVTNSGEGEAINLVIKDKVPEGLLLIEDSISDNGVLKDGVITWKIGTLNADDIATVSFDVIIPVVKVDTSWTNVASTSCENNPENPDPTPEVPNPDPKEEESNPVEVTEYVPVIDIVKEQKVNDGESSTTPQEVKAGDRVTYTLKIANSGNGAATGLVIKDEIPEGLFVVEESILGGVLKDGVITWEIDKLNAGDVATVSFDVIIPVVKEDTSWTNMGSVSYVNNPENPEPDPENPEEPVNPTEIYSDEVEIETKVPVITIVKEQKVNIGFSSTASKAVKAGDKVTYTIKVTNSGNGEATNLVIRDEVPKGLILDEDSISGTGILENGVITWKIGTLEAGGVAVVSFEVEVPETEKAQNWTNIATTTYDNNPENPEETPENPNPDPTPVESNEVELTQTPKTGDETNIILYVALSGLALCAVAAGVVVRKRNRR